MPRIDQRDFQTLLKERENIIPYYTPEWNAGDDAGFALLKIFTHMQEEIINRLNRVPEKNFAAFLEMIGIKLTPAQPAKAPVTFYLPERMSGGVFVPRRTQAATEETDKHKALVFETMKSFFAASAGIEEIFCVDPERDEIFRYDPKKEFRIFVGEKNMQEHVLYLGHKELFNLKGKAEIRLKFTLVSANPKSLKKLIWEYWGEKESPETFAEPVVKYDALKEEYSVVLASRGEIKEKEINGLKNRWIQCRLTQVTDSSDLPVVANIKIFDVSPADPIEPDIAFYNSVPLNLKADFYPLGAQPRLFDTFYVASKEAFTKKKANITLTFTKKSNATVKPDNVVLSWEYWNGTLWKPLEKTADTLGNFGTSGDVVFGCPEELEELEVNGEKNYWIRIRLISGNYGRDKFERDSELFWKITPEYFPPLISKIGIKYSFETKGFDLEYCLAKNNLEFRDFTKESKQDTGFKPFIPLPENRPALYLGFNDSFRKGNISIFFSLIDKTYPPESRPKIEWKYWSRAPNLIKDVTNPKEVEVASTEGISIGTELLFKGHTDSGLLSETAIVSSFSEGKIALVEELTRRYTTADAVFRRTFLEVSDNTEYLTKSGTLEFIAPAEHSKTHKFGKESYWLMGAFTRPEKTYEPPLLKGIYSNTVWAEEVETIEDEIIGSSDGNKNQSYRFIRTPVISPEIWVKEEQMVSQVERDELPGEDIKEIKDSTGKTKETWVRWRDVNDFLDSGPKDRHCVIDSSMGTVQFGDGDHGMIPLIGKDNIKANYRSGGGVKGNVARNEISVLKTPVAGIGRVNNPEPAEGGSDTEPLEEVFERGPHLIKHRDRAVTKEDFERIAQEASSYIARTKCFIEGNRLNIIVIPQGEEDRPLPSLGLKRVVEKHLIERCLNLILIESIEIKDPAYKEIKVTVDVVPESIDRAIPLEKEIRAQLKKYLHPLTGGYEKKGWEFGRGVHISDVYAILESIKDVDHVENLELNGLSEDVEIKESETVCSGEHRITMRAK